MLLYDIQTASSDPEKRHTQKRLIQVFDPKRGESSVDDRRPGSLSDANSLGHPLVHTTLVPCGIIR